MKHRRLISSEIIAMIVGPIVGLLLFLGFISAMKEMGDAETGVIVRKEKGFVIVKFDSPYVKVPISEVQFQWTGIGDEVTVRLDRTKWK